MYVCVYRSHLIRPWTQKNWAVVSGVVNAVVSRVTSSLSLSLSLSLPPSLSQCSVHPSEQQAATHNGLVRAVPENWLYSCFCTYSGGTCAWDPG